MREVLIGVAKAGLFQPLWSDRILEEWARASVKLGPTGEAQARAEIALTRANWPGVFSLEQRNGLQQSCEKAMSFRRCGAKPNATFPLKDVFC